METTESKDNFDSHLDSHHDLKIFGLHALIRINGPDQILVHQETMQDLFWKCNNEP